MKDYNKPYIFVFRDNGNIDIERKIYVDDDNIFDFKLVDHLENTHIVAFGRGNLYNYYLTFDPVSNFTPKVFITGY